MVIDLVDGTYELFRHFYGLRRFTQGEDRPFGAVVGVLQGVLQMIERQATHIKAKKIRDAGDIRAKFGVEPALIPDDLALVGDAADGYPGLDGIGAVSAARLLNRYGRIEDFPADVLGERQAAALLFKQLATLRTDAKLFEDVEALRWRGRTAAFAEWTERVGADKLLQRCLQVQQALAKA